MTLANAARAFAWALLAFFALGYALNARAEGTHWTYHGHGGPGEWGGLSQEFANCRIGRTQSPIDIHDAKVADLPPIRFDYKPSPLVIVDNGHTIQLNYAPGSSLVVGGVRYELVQFDFLKPSEEKIDGKAHPMVAHLVHRSADDSLAVVAVLLDTGGDSAMLDMIWKHLPRQKEKEVAVVNAAIDVSALLPAQHGYYTFQGSLTTPPCSEKVTWIVLKTPVKISAAAVATFGKIYPMNARPVQPVNGRLIQATP